MIIRNHKCNGVPMFPIFLRQRAWRKKQELIPCQAAGNRKDSNAGKPVYATVSCQLLRPRVRAMPFCEGARCAMKAQQRNTKHTQFSAWNLCGACVADRISQLFGGKKKRAAAEAATLPSCQTSQTRSPPGSFARHLPISCIHSRRNCSHFRTRSRSSRSAAESTASYCRIRSHHRKDRIHSHFRYCTRS